MERIMIIGPPGSGKTTLATQLATCLKLPLHHVDQLFFTDHWEERLTEDFVRDHEAILSEAQWTLDGNAMRHLVPRAQAADTLIYLDVPRLACLWRILKRHLRHRKQSRADRPHNCPEQIRWSLITYCWNWRRRYEAKIEQLRRNNPHLQYLQFRHSRELCKWLKENAL